MSWQAVQRCWGLELDRSHLLVLIAFAEHADPRGCESFPSLERVAWMTGFSTRWVRSLVSDLRSLGVLVPERRANQRRPTTYKIQVDALRHRSDGRSRGSTEPAPRKEPSV